LYGAFVWARRALNGRKRRFAARAVTKGAVLLDQVFLERQAARFADQPTRAVTKTLPFCRASTAFLT
jgi:hypothetical protein